MAVRPMTQDDAPWAASLMELRRDEYQRYAPVFWRPTAGIAPFHAEFLAAQIADPTVVALRTSTGFAVATPGESHFYVDDFALENGDWDRTGAELLRGTWEAASHLGADYLRVVTAQRDTPKVALLTTHGLHVATQWWVRPVHGKPANPSDESSEDFEIHETNAPPVYDPGGAVGILTSFTSASLGRAVRAGASRGLAVLIAPTPSGDGREAGLSAAGFAVASQFYEGVPSSG